LNSRCGQFDSTGTFYRSNKSKQKSPGIVKSDFRQFRSSQTRLAKLSVTLEALQAPSGNNIEQQGEKYHGR
jgi:hypothetical protein